MSWERPKSVFEIHNFLGLVGYYRRFIKDFSWLAAPMIRLTRKKVKFEWNDLCEKCIVMPLMSLKVIYFQSIFLIGFYIKRLIYRQEYGITSPNLLCSRKFKRKQKLL